MTVNRVENYFNETAQKSNKSQKRKNNQLWDRFMSAEEAKSQKDKNAAVNKKDAYCHSKGVSTDYAVYTGQGLYDEKAERGKAVRAGSVRSVSYEECDYVNVCAQEGYVFKAKADESSGQVYVEQRFEDGTVKAYEVDIKQVDENTQDLVEQAALKAWGRTQENKGVRQDFEQALENYTAYVRERVKEGPEKFQIGASSMSLKEWDTLMEKVDEAINAIREAMEKEIEMREMKEEAERLRELKEYQFEIGDMESYQYSERLYEMMINEQIIGDDSLQFLTELTGVESIHLMDGRLQSGIIGLTTLGSREEMQIVTVSYADDSTVDNPIIEIRMRQLEENGNQENAYRVNVKEIRPEHATQMEMLALCAYADHCGLSGAGREGESYMKLLNAIEDTSFSEANTVKEFTQNKQDWTQLMEEQQEISQQNRVHSLLTDRLNGKQSVPYSYLADDSGVIEYNGVIFKCDEEHNALCLGDVSDPTKILIIPLSNGGSLKVNRANLGDLSKAISMFSPEDINRIMRAIALDKKAQQMQQEMDDMEASIGERLKAGE